MTATPGTASALLRPRDSDAIRGALRAARSDTRVPLAFGGQVLDGELCLTEFAGTRTTGLRGLHVLPGEGLGGRALATARPVAVRDYAPSRDITHAYDGPILAEGIRGLVAVPIVVGGDVRGVLYAGARAIAPLGDVVTQVLVEAAGRLAREFTMRDEVDRRLRLMLSPASAGQGPPTRDGSPVRVDAATMEEVRALQAELRQIAQAVADPLLREQLRQSCDRLARIGSPEPSQPCPLSPREVDVLSQVALGCTNAEVAQRISISPETVKAYLRSASGKLGTHTRAETVNAARRSGGLV